MNAGTGDPQLAAGQRARVLIDGQFADAGWSVQDKKSLNLFASDGVACREVVMKAGHGRATTCSTSTGLSDRRQISKLATGPKDSMRGLARKVAVDSGPGR